MAPENGATKSIENTLSALSIKVVHKAQFPDKHEKRLLDYIVRREPDITFIKIAKTVHTNSDIFKELKRLSSFLKINSLLIADKINDDNAVEGVLHIRDRVGIVRFKTVYNVVKGEKVYIYEFKGMYYVKVDGKKLRELRIRKGYSLGELAKAVGASVKALQKYEEGLIDMSVEKAYRFIELFDKDFENVLKEVDIFRDRIPQSTRRKNISSSIREEGSKYRLLKKLVSQNVEIETFDHFPSDIILSRESTKVFISLISKKMDVQTATSKAKENKVISQIFRGIPVNIVEEEIGNDIIKELDEFGIVYKCEDVVRYGLDLERDTM